MAHSKSKPKKQVKKVSAAAQRKMAQQQQYQSVGPPVAGPGQVPGYKKGGKMKGKC